MHESHCMHVNTCSLTDMSQGLTGSAFRKESDIVGGPVGCDAEVLIRCALELQVFRGGKGLGLEAGVHHVPEVAGHLWCHVL